MKTTAWNRKHGRSTVLEKDMFMLDWEPVEKLKQVWCSQFYVFSVRVEQHSFVCDKGFGQRKQADQKGENCSSQSVTEWVRWSVSLWPQWKDTSRQTNSTELVVAGFGGLTDEVFHGQCAVEENTEAFDRVRERDCGIIKLKGVDGNRRQFLSCSNEHCFCLFTI